MQRAANAAWAAVRFIVGMGFAVALLAGAVINIVALVRGTVPPLAVALRVLGALVFAYALAMVAVYGLSGSYYFPVWRRAPSSSLGRYLRYTVGFYIGCAVAFGLSGFLAYLCIHGFHTGQAPTIGRYVHQFWFARADHPSAFWVSMTFYTLLSAFLFGCGLLAIYGRYTQWRKA